MSTIVIPTAAEDARDAAIAREVLRGPSLAREHYRNDRDRIVANLLYFLPWFLALLGIGQAVEVGPLTGSNLAVVVGLVVAAAGLAAVADAVVLRRYCVYGDELTA
ncbi:MAG: hypothetical protein U0Q07_13280 [Acidimicrobiales bacterium]